MDPFILVVGGIGFGIAGLVWYFGKRQALMRRLKQAKPWPVGELPEDTLGKIVGNARPVGDVLTAPISQRPCVFFEVSVVENHGKSSSTIIHELQGVPFYVEDASGRAVVDPRGADVVLEQDYSTSSGTLDDATPIEEEFLRRHNKEPRGWVFNKSLSYRESIIAIGEQVAVLGSGVREPDPDAPPTQDYRGAMPTRLRLTNSRVHKLVISDLPSTTR